MKRLVAATALAWVAVQSSAAAREYQVAGMVLTVDPSRRTFSASVDAVAGFMPAMTMPFEVRRRADLDGLVPGAHVEFTLVVAARSSHAERIRIVQYRSAEQDPLSANRLKLLTRLAGAPSHTALAVGEVVPDFRLIDERHRPVTLSGLRGKVVAINFVYTSCALPELCLRIANNFAVLLKRFKARLGRDLVLLTITFDPVHDTPDVLAQYARRWNADPATWRFLTGPPDDVRGVCRGFGVDFFPDEGLMAHSLHTVILDRRGRMAANIEGNRFTSDQLGDLIAAVLGTVD